MQCIYTMVSWLYVECYLCSSLIYFKLWWISWRICILTCNTWHQFLHAWIYMHLPYLHSYSLTHTYIYIFMVTETFMYVKWLIMITVDKRWLVMCMQVYECMYMNVYETMLPWYWICYIYKFHFIVHCCIVFSWVP